jgi:hypothetical protein
LAATDMQQGLGSPAFQVAAQGIQLNWCSFLSEAFEIETVAAQKLPENDWTIHPLVDGCQPAVPLAPLT